MNFSNINKSFLFALFTFLISYFILGDIFISALGISFFVFGLFEYLLKIDRGLPILELVLLMALLQWVVGPYLEYRFDSSHFKYYMYVNESRYMSFVVPGLLFFTLGLKIFYKNVDISLSLKVLETFVDKNPKVPLYFIIIGFLAFFLRNKVPGGLGFFLFLTSNLRFIGIILLLFKNNSRFKWIVFFLVMIFTFTSSLRSGMFHDFFLWGILLAGYVILYLKVSIFNRVALVIIGFSFVVSVQSIKADYRILLSSDEIGSKFDLFVSLLHDKFTNNPKSIDYDDRSMIEQVNVRINQGWIISSILYNVPLNEPFANGETILEALNASLLPRFLSPNKKLAGGRENFERFTGLPLNSQASMGTSVIGEAYGNFGEIGAWLFMFVYGVFLSFLVKSIFNLSLKTNTLIIWVPLIFLQVIKAETEVYVVFNHLIKACIFVWIIFMLSKTFFKVSL